MIVDPASTDYVNVYKLLIGSVVPRPIAFVSTVNSDGAFNLAPFSFFTVASANPPVLLINVSRRSNPDPRKDTLRNITIAREFVVNVVSEEIGEKMNLCAGEYPPEVDEFEVSGLTPIPSDLVKAPRVAESPINMECRLLYTLEMSGLEGGGHLVLGQVIRFHIDDAYFHNYRIDADKLGAIGRMAGNSYTRTLDRFDLIRPA
ncbi:MAG: flavin reductase family protein [Bryobacteraceae bacterium]|jgi:flavin reductase (DIM6/NTAB) family NADH-FMN oxidoreductase RutF